MARRSTPRPKQARSELSTVKLLDTAAELIGEVGYDRMTLAAIGDRAGYSQGLVTGRFGSKEGLLWALIERMVVDWRHELVLPALKDLAGRDALHHVTAELRKSWSRRQSSMRAVYMLMFEGLLSIGMLSERMATLHRDTRIEIAEAVQRGIDRGIVASSVDAGIVARLFVGALRGSAYQHLLDPAEFPIDEALEDIDRLIDALLPVGQSASDGVHKVQHRLNQHDLGSRPTSAQVPRFEAPKRI
jgi:AcrR family transcriptional regulator